MRLIATIAGVLTALVLMAVSAFMNYQFMLGQGKTITEGQMLGVASVATDMFKALAPFFFYWAWRSSRYVIGVIGFGVWVMFSAFSLISAIGFSAENRAAVSGSKEAITATYLDAKNELETAKEKRKLLGTVQPVSSVASALEAMKQHKRWKSTKGCSDATATASREFCKKFFKIKGTMGAAVEVGRLDKKIDKLRAEVKRLRALGAGGDSDPQLGILKTLSGLEMGTVKTSLVTFIAILIELGSSLGLFLATSHSEIFSRKKSPIKTSKTANDNEGTMENTAIIQGNVVDYIGERIVFRAGAQTMVQDMYYGYCEWCHQHNYTPYDTTIFHEEIAYIIEGTKIIKDGNLCKELYFTGNTLEVAAE